MKIIGLTGTIASGKSTVATILRVQRDVEFISLDEIARRAVEPGTPALRKIFLKFGLEFAQPDGSLDRKKLGNFVFSNLEVKHELELIMHPAIQTTYQQELHKLYEEEFVIVENAILFDSPEYKQMDGFIIVDVNAELQKNRLMARNNLTETEANIRINAQTSLASKMALANATESFYVVINNDGVLEDLVRNTLDAWDVLTGQI